MITTGALPATHDVFEHFCHRQVGVPPLYQHGVFRVLRQLGLPPLQKPLRPLGFGLPGRRHERLRTPARIKSLPGAVHRLLPPPAAPHSHHPPQRVHGASRPLPPALSASHPAPGSMRPPHGACCCLLRAEMGQKSQTLTESTPNTSKIGFG